MAVKELFKPVFISTFICAFVFYSGLFNIPDRTEAKALIKKEDFTYDFVASGIEGHVVSASVIREEQKETIPMDDERVARGIEKLSLLSAETILLAVRHDDPALFDTLLTLLLK